MKQYMRALIFLLVATRACSILSVQHAKEKAYFERSVCAAIADTAFKRDLLVRTSGSSQSYNFHQDVFLLHTQEGPQFAKVMSLETSNVRHQKLDDLLCQSLQYFVPGTVSVVGGMYAPYILEDVSKSAPTLAALTAMGYYLLKRGYRRLTSEPALEALVSGSRIWCGGDIVGLRIKPRECVMLYPGIQNYITELVKNGASKRDKLCISMPCYHAENAMSKKG